MGAPEPLAALWTRISTLAGFHAGRGGRARLAIAAGFAARAWLLVVALVSVPVTIRYLGNDGYWRPEWWQEAAVHTWYGGKWNHYDLWLGFKGMELQEDGNGKYNRSDLASIGERPLLVWLQAVRATESFKAIEEIRLRTITTGFIRITTGGLCCI